MTLSKQCGFWKLVSVNFVYRDRTRGIATDSPARIGRRSSVARSAFGGNEGVGSQESEVGEQRGQGGQGRQGRITNYQLPITNYQPVVEATGWAIAPSEEVMLTTSAPDSVLQKSMRQPNNCNRR